MLGFIKRNCSRDLPSNALKALYLALRSHLGYYCQLYAPQSVIRNILLIESIQRRATKFLCKYSNASYKERLVLLNLLPLNYWLEYLDLVFFFKCKTGLYAIDLSKYVTFATASTRRGSSGLNLKYSCIPRTSSFRDTYFIRIVNTWNALPNNIKGITILSTFKSKRKAFFSERLRLLFDQDNIRSYKIACPKCRSIRPLTLCSC